MEITNFTFMVYFIPKIIHSSTCSVGFEYLNELLVGFAYNRILSGMWPDNDFPCSESSTAGGLRAENLVSTLLLVSQPVLLRVQYISLV